MLFNRDSVKTSQPSPYYYHPSVALAVVSAIAFSLATLAHGWLFFRGKVWFFWTMLIGALIESIGFTARAISVQNLQEPYPFVVAYLAPIFAPSFIAAACYVTFGRIVWWVTPTEDRTFTKLWCPPRFLTLIFVTFDLISFLIQLLGASAVGTAYANESLNPEERDKKLSDGLAVLRIGLVLQLLCFVTFAIIGTRFIVISRRWTRIPLRYGIRHAKWTRLNWTVNIAATVIMGRAIYRMLEFMDSRGNLSYLQTHEWPFFVFDALPMLCILISFLVIQPAQYFPSEFLSLRLNKRKLNQVENSSPPTYLQSVHLQTVRG